MTEHQKQTISRSKQEPIGNAAAMTGQAVRLFADYQRSGRLDLINGAIELLRNAVAATSPDHPDRPVYLSNLGAALQARFGRTGDQADLDAAVALFRDAVAATPLDHPDRPGRLSNLGTAQRVQFERTGLLADLDEAIAVGRDAVAATPPNHPNRPGYLSNLGAALGVQFERTGLLADLEQAITAAHEATTATRPDHPNRPGYLSNLGAALQARFERTGQQDDLDQAITTFREAVTTAPPNHPNHPRYLSNLGLALQAQFRSTVRYADLDQAIAAFRDAVAATPPDNPNYPGRLSNLGGALWTRFDRTGQQAELDAAVDLFRGAVTTTPSDHPNRPRYLSNLGAALQIQFERTGQQDHLDEAITAERDVVATTPLDHPDRCDRLYNLGLSLRARFGRTGREADLDEAITAFRNAVAVKSGPPAARMRAGRAWGRAAIDVGWVNSAAEGFASAVELLPLLAWLGLPRATRERHLAEWSGLAADAAACAIRAGHPQRAVELLEASRSMLWAQTLNLRTDLSDLAQLAPDLATRLDQIRAQLDTSILASAPEEISANAGDPVGQLRAAQNRIVEDRMGWAREFDDLVSEVRTLDGFAHFLTPTPFAQLRAAATGGPVVIVNTSRHGCHAILVTTTGARVVELPDLTHDQAIEQANLLGALTHAGHADRPVPDREKDRQTVLNILAWLWDAIAAPVLTNLSYTSPPAPDNAWPRIWWCPTGPLTLLPLHAAGHHHLRHQRSDGPASTDTVPDRVISSYAPTLTALLRAHTAAVPPSRPQLLAIGMPTTPGASDLDQVPTELDRIQLHYPIATRLQSPTRQQFSHGSPPDPRTQPTITRVLAQLPRHTWVHLACHGSQHFSDPTESAFWLTDGLLRITDLIEQRESGPRELAFLSACQTATGSPKAIDEAIHLAAAMQLLGYRHVIATLWSIYDAPAPDIAGTVYATLTATGTPNAIHTAHGLHRAVMALRAKYPGDPLAWAPYLHTGP
ncbi:MAG: CHAT domain-containing protein [Pseudonocardiales bacterium]|nr:CHAT domain-containing protein [Pseudonocardiales bacterium]